MHVHVSNQPSHERRIRDIQPLKTFMYAVIQACIRLGGEAEADFAGKTSLLCSRFCQAASFFGVPSVEAASCT